MIKVNNDALLGLNIDSLIKSNQISTKLEREKASAQSKSALIDEQLKIIRLANEEKNEKGQLTQKILNKS